MGKTKLLIVAIVVSLLAVELPTHRFQAIAHELSPSSMGGGTIAGPTILPRQAQQMLSTVEIISIAQQGVTDVNVSASVLCFCLYKAGENVQELRRLRNERFNNGAVLFKARKYAEAVTAFTKAISMNLRDAAVYMNRGLSHANTGNYEQALADFTQAIDLDHHLAVAFYARSMTFFIMQKAADAHQDLQRAALLHYPPAHRLLNDS